VVPDEERISMAYALASRQSEQLGQMRKATNSRAYPEQGASHTGFHESSLCVCLRIDVAKRQRAE
jgi:hypothetical protein